MRLRTKLVVLIAVVCIVPIVAAALLGREMVRRSSQEQYRRLLGDARAEVQAGYGAVQEEVTAAVRRLSSQDDLFVGRILLAMARGGGALDAETVRELARVAPRVMRERGLDVLSVLDPHGKILASGHFPGQIGDTDPRLGQYLRTPRGEQPLLLPVRVMEGKKPETRYAVQVSRSRSSYGHKVFVVGGRTMGPRFVRRLRLRGGTEIRIEDREGRQLAGPRSWARYRRYPSQLVRWSDPDGREVLRVTLAVPDDQLRRTLGAINTAAASLVGSGLLLSLLLGGILARSIGRPLQELAQGADAVARGNLDMELRVRSRDEVGQLVRAFNRMTADLKDSKEKLVAAERVAAWREIARRIAHEIKNPLFPIQTSIETLRKVQEKQHPDFEEIFHESTATILEEVQRLKTIATEFSQFARMPKPRIEPCPLRDVLGTVTTLYGAGDLPLTLDVGSDLPDVLGDREQLVQVFSNLVKNAREALGAVERPRITVGARADGEGWVRVRVEDNGPGFSEEVEAKIFTPYFTTKGASGGSGLGLAIVHRIVLDHGGRIEARSGEQGGAVFSVWLPAAPRDAAADTVPAGERHG